MSDDGVRYVAADDAQMNWAMEKARLTLGYFRESLAHPRPHQSGFALKVRMMEGGDVEHFWLRGLSLDEQGHFRGQVDNQSVLISGISLDDRILVRDEDISDWMILEDGRLIGGYTIRAAREQMDAEEQRDFDRSVGFVIDMGVDHFPHSPDSPEGAILCLEDAYTAGDLEAAVACKDFRAEAGFILDQQSDFPKEEALIADMANVLELSFREFMLENGLPSFEGVERAFPERIRVDERSYLITELCYHPDGRRTLDRLLVIRSGDEWRVGPPMNDEE